MDPALATVIAAAIAGFVTLVGVLVSAVLTLKTSADRASLRDRDDEIRSLRKQVVSLGGDPDEE